MISNFFPPSIVGGYEIAAAETALGLRALGAEVMVLTSGIQSGKASSEPEFTDIAVHRVLEYSNPHGLDLTSLRKPDIEEVLKLVSDFAPTTFYIWNISGLNRSHLGILGRRFPTAKIRYHIMDHKWSLFGLKKPPFSRRSGAIFCSEFLSRRFGANVFAERVVIPPPVPQKMDSVTFADNTAHPISRDFKSEFRGVFIGQLAPHKGVPGILRAAEMLADSFPQMELHLYSPRIHEARIKRVMLPNVEVFFGIDREKILATLPQYDFGLFPTDWPEPYGMALAELVASGVPTVSTSRGGSAEIQSPLVVHIRSSSGSDIADGIQKIYNTDEFRQGESRARHASAFRALKTAGEYNRSVQAFLS